MKIQIKHRYTGDVIFEAEALTVKLAIVAAVEADADLRGAVLTGADLADADLRGAVLTGADLADADLRGAVLTDADLTGAVLADAVLTGADLTGAVLTDADLTGAVLTGAVLRGAVLRGAVLRGAVLRGAVLRDAVLTGADLRGAKNDLWAVLMTAPLEVDGLLTSLREGRVDGSCYEGACACLVGTIANIKGCNYQDVPNLTPNASRPAERWFLGISKDHTPENSPIVKITVEWIEEFKTLFAIAIAAFNVSRAEAK
jgi:hypothetical protein